MNKNRINKRVIKTNLLFTCIFLILIGTFIIGKNFTKGNVKAESVNKVATATINPAVQNNNEAKPQGDIADNNEIKKPLKDNLNDNQTTETSNKTTKKSSDSKEEKYIYDAEKVNDVLAYKEKNDGKKIAFLTFDDGPSTTVTPKILDTLKQYNVKATFFLIGENIDSNEASKELVKREFNEGHAIGNHTYSHNRGNMLFPGRKVNVPVFMADVEKTDKALKNVLGQDFNTRILRLPGGYMSRTYKMPNLPELDAKLKEKNMVSVDWNAESKDAEGKPNKSATELFNILKEGVGTKQKVVILMHDTYGKMQTANALPQVIEYLKGQGYEFRTIE